MAKPATIHGYSDLYTRDCERVLVTLLRGLGPWKNSVYLAPVSVAKFEFGESDDPEQREARALRQREVSEVIQQLLARIG